MTPTGSIFARALSMLSVPPGDDEHAALDELIPDGDEFGPYVRRFSALTMLSASIAAFGLLADSAAVVIGAMLVAPLMVPITAAAGATVLAQNRRLVRALLVIALGVFLAIAVGYLTAAVAGFDIVGRTDLPGEVEGRTFPGLLDLGIAITAGAAAGYIATRRSTTSALPGVGIAVALVPPLATVGITLQLGLGTEARNAMLLFLTNLAAIIFTASIMLLISGFRPSETTNGRSLPLRLAITLLAVVVVAVPLTLHTQTTIRDSSLRRAVTESVEEWDDTVRVVELRADLVDGTAEVELILSGPNVPRPAWQLAELVRDSFGTPVDLELRYDRDDLFVVSAR
ncbi:MAG: putative hydrophobic protein (TIGR00271 family) [Ilumatobacter sp.]|jgi:uncharacterized hydrophobic protein (TIGR00271 family)